jgi:hypothetical protein
VTESTTTGPNGEESTTGKCQMLKSNNFIFVKDLVET